MLHPHLVLRWIWIGGRQPVFCTGRQNGGGGGTTRTSCCAFSASFCAFHCSCSSPTESNTFLGFSASSASRFFLSSCAVPRRNAKTVATVSHQASDLAAPEDKGMHECKSAAIVHRCRLPIPLHRLRVPPPSCDLRRGKTNWILCTCFHAGVYSGLFCDEGRDEDVTPGP
jgi:hypothetical protein